VILRLSLGLLVVLCGPTGLAADSFGAPAAADAEADNPWVTQSPRPVALPVGPVVAGKLRTEESAGRYHLDCSADLKTFTLRGHATLTFEKKR
jgi:hypothetical protein